MSDSPVLIRAEATGVLGEYDHSLPFPVDHEYVIVYGPNGVGKTKFLEIINGLSRLDGRLLLGLPFETVELEFSDGSLLQVEEQRQRSETRQGPRRELQFTLRRVGRKASNWTYKGANFEDWLVESTPWRPLDGGLWEDRTDGEIAPLAELESRYEGAVSEGVEAPADMREFAQAHPSYLIETQRLKSERTTLRRPHTWRPGARAKNLSRISQQAATMRSLVNDAQTEHSRITQQLDRTFPNRILEDVGQRVVDDELLRERYNKQNVFRSRLGRVASVALEDALSLPDRELAESELRLLNLYLDDAERKLAPFANLLEKVELLEQTVNSRLLRKRLQVTAEDGLTVVHDPSGRTIDLDSLSSGEQHEVILMFDLLFGVPQGALVLIDEPEISLHVVWQLAFIADVQKIARVSGFRFVVATHSPQVINDSWSRATRLGPPEAAFQ